MNTWLPWYQQFNLFKKLESKDAKKYCEALIEGTEEKKQNKLNAASISTLGVDPDSHTSKKQAYESPTPVLFSSNAVNAAKAVN